MLLSQDILLLCLYKNKLIVLIEYFEFHKYMTAYHSEVKEVKTCSPTNLGILNIISKVKQAISENAFKQIFKILILLVLASGYQNVNLIQTSPNTIHLYLNANRH